MSKQIKAGDLCFIAACIPSPLRELEGRIVQAIAPVDVNGEPGWQLDRKCEFVMLETARGPTGVRYIGESVYIDVLQTRFLRPIRGQPGEDESLAWIKELTV